MAAVLIGFGHAARVGKDSSARILVEEYGFTSMAFADALRSVAYESNPAVRRLVDLEGWEVAKTVYPTVRQYLVDLGNACRRNIGCDIWVDAVFAKVDSNRDFVITDVRYPNEVQRVLGHGGLAVKVTRPGIEPMDNVADQALAGYCGWSTELINDGTLADLKVKVADLLAHPSLRSEVSL